MKKILLATLIIFSLQIKAQYYWEEITPPEGISLYAVYGVNENHILLGGTEGLYTTFDGGATWEHTIQSVHSCGNIKVYKNRYYTWISGGLYRKIGIHGEWVLISGEKGVSSGHYYFVNDTVIIAGGGEAIIKTTDGGYTWFEIYEGGHNESFQCINQHPSGVLFAGSRSYAASTISGLYKSEDEGDSWSKIALEYYSNDIIRINPDGDIYVGCYNRMDAAAGGVFKSSELGATWEALRDDMSVTGLVVTPGDTVYAASHGFELTTAGVHMSPDGGETWQNITSNIEWPGMYKLELGKDGHIYTISDKIYRSKAPVAVGISKTNHSVPAILNMYPNPATSQLHVECGQPYRQKHITVYSMAGTPIRSFSTKAAQFTIDITALPENCYLLKVENKNTVQTQLFTKH